MHMEPDSERRVREDSEAQWRKLLGEGAASQAAIQRAVTPPTAAEYAKLRAQHAEKQARLAGRQAERELGLRLIDIGYKQLRKDSHPKLASSQGILTRLRRARTRLRDKA